LDHQSTGLALPEIFVILGEAEQIDAALVLTWV